MEVLCLAATLIACISCTHNVKEDALDPAFAVQEEFSNARFGLFIHFGLYSVPAGIWQGDTIPVGGMAEHLMRLLRIPRDEYRQIAKQFNPSKFDSREIVSLARKAGMKYIVFTAKHHDGFAMFDSEYDLYNIKDGTPYGKDLLKELSEECKRQGMKLGVYYSHTRDWDEYHSVTSYNNDWDWSGDDPARDARIYMEAKVKLQLEELLTNYGDIYCLWFDTPYDIPEDLATEIYNLVKELQPSCMVNSRIGAGLGDYGIMGDNQVPPGVLQGSWECPATMNHSWGYHQLDTTWKSSEHMIMQLADLSSKNINYLLDIGPRSDGSVPEESIQKLEKIGEWMNTNGEAIYGKGPSPWFQEMDGFRVTSGKDALYLTLLDPELEKITLYNLNNEITRVESLDGEIRIPFTSRKLEVPPIRVLELTLPPELRDLVFPVIQISMKGSPDVSDHPTQMGSGNVLLQCGMAHTEGKAGKLEIAGMDGVIDTNNWPYFSTRNWTSTGDYLKWNLNVTEPGTFEVQVVNVSTVRSLESHHRKWDALYQDAGDMNQLSLELDGQNIRGPLTGKEEVSSFRSMYRPEFISRIGRIKIDRPGSFEAVLKAEYINPQDKDGLVIYEVRLIKIF